MLTQYRSRRYVLRSMALVGASAVLAACGSSLTPTLVPAGSAAPQKTDAGAAAPASAKPGAIGGGLSGTIELYFPRTTVCRFCTVVDTWNANHPEAKVVDKDVPWSGEKQLAALAAGQGGPDLYQSDPQEVQRDMLGRKLLDVTEVVQPAA